MGWIVIEATSGRENKIAQEVVRDGYAEDAFVPSVTRTVKHARRERTVVVPLWSRYLLASVDLYDRRWVGIEEVRGVIRLLGSPTQLKQHVVDQVRGFDEKAKALTRGDRIRLLSGRYAGIEVLFSAFDEDCMVVEMMFMGHIVPTVLGRERFERVA